jgi:hypothetical protein
VTLASPELVDANYLPAALLLMLGASARSLDISLTTG